MSILLGLWGGFRLPRFLKNPLFWKAAAIVVAVFFIWFKATSSANSRWQLAMAHKTAALRAQASQRINEQRDLDMKRILELETINHELETRNSELVRRRSEKKNALSNSCTLCRIPRGRSPRRLRR